MTKKFKSLFKMIHQFNRVNNHSYSKMMTGQFDLEEEERSKNLKTKYLITLL